MHPPLLRAATAALYEYLVVTTPVGVFVAFEAHHARAPGHFFHSPEWSIAIVFLTIQGVTLYIRELRQTGREISDSATGILTLIAFLVAIGAAMNAYLDMEQPTSGTRTLRLVLFILVSLVFGLMVTAAKLAVITYSKGE